MKVTRSISRFVVDRRRHVAVGVVAIVLATFGVMSSADEADEDDDDLVYLVSTALDRGQQTFARRIPFYRPASVVLFTSTTKTACGQGETATGPFYCARDERIYLDLAFLRAVSGDLARAYVIFHELGHHAQHLRRAGVTGPALELQADCYAGQLIASQRSALDITPSDIEQAIDLAARAGDSPRDPLTHGTSEQRVYAVTTGIAGGSCE